MCSSAGELQIEVVVQDESLDVIFKWDHAEFPLDLAVPDEPGSVGRYPEYFTLERLESTCEKNLCCPTTDEYLLRFVRASKNDIRLSHKLVKDYFKARYDHPEEFLFGPAEDYLDYISTSELGYVLPHTDKKGRRIIVIRVGNLDPFEQEWEDVIQVGAIVLESASLDHEIQVNGSRLIADCTNFSVRMMKWATPHKLKVIMKFLQDSIPIRFECIDIVNAPMIFNMFWGAMKPFMLDSFVEKVEWHKAPYTKLHSLIDPSYLTPWMGGTLELKSIHHWHKDVLKNDKVLREYSKYGYQKSPR